jgi:hypothetical protein
LLLVAAVEVVPLVAARLVVVVLGVIALAFLVSLLGVGLRLKLLWVCRLVLIRWRWALVALTKHREWLAFFLLSQLLAVGVERLKFWLPVAVVLVVEAQTVKPLALLEQPEKVLTAALRRLMRVLAVVVPVN